MTNTIYNILLQNAQEGKKQIILLIDPDKHTNESLQKTVENAEKADILMYFVGGSLISGSIDWAIEKIKSLSSKKVVIFPGSTIQITTKADGILFISLVSGRNPEFLIGNHVIAAPFIQQANLETLPTGYLLIEGGNFTSVEYMSGTKPIPASKTDIAIATALASKMLGQKLLYLDAGSGALFPVSQEMIRKVKAATKLPLIIGGGIKTAIQAKLAFEAGADFLVVGSAIEEDSAKLFELTKATKVQ
jgi:phosphoglycerol geranylgeranyltransferase